METVFPLTCPDFWVSNLHVTWNLSSSAAEDWGLLKRITSVSFVSRRSESPKSYGQEKLRLMITKCVALSNAINRLLKAGRELLVYLPFHWGRCNDFCSSFIIPICCNLVHAAGSWKKKIQDSPLADLLAHLLSLPIWTQCSRWGKIIHKTYGACFTC